MAYASLDPWSIARLRKVAISARVVMRLGQNLDPSPHPTVMPEALSLATSAAYHASSGTSEKSAVGSVWQIESPRQKHRHLSSIHVTVRTESTTVTAASCNTQLRHPLNERWPEGWKAAIHIVES